MLIFNVCSNNTKITYQRRLCLYKREQGIKGCNRAADSLEKLHRAHFSVIGGRCGLPLRIVLDAWEGLGAVKKSDTRAHTITVMEVCNGIKCISFRVKVTAILVVYVGLCHDG